MGKTNKVKDWDSTYDKYTEEEISEIKHLPMKIGEIMDHYKRSHRTKVEKITILSELNGCDKELIGMIVERECGSKGRPAKKETVAEKTTRTVAQKSENAVTNKQKTVKKPREKVAPNVYWAIEREYHQCKERIDSIKTQLDSAQKALVDFTDFLETHTIGD